jgi:hypothetical protein
MDHSRQTTTKEQTEDTMKRSQLAKAIADLDLQIKVLETARAALLKLQPPAPKLRAVKTAPKESA